MLYNLAVIAMHGLAFLFGWFLAETIKHFAILNHRGNKE